MFSVRPAKLGDAACLPAIERSAGKAFLAIADLAWIADDEIRSEAWHRQHIGRNSSWVVTDREDVPVGFLCAEPLGGNLHIWEVAIRYTLQRRGLGRMLIEHAARSARMEGWPSLTLTTFRDVSWNEPFYHRLGFTTLEAHQLTSELRAVLEAEAKNGLAPARKCAMIRVLR